jgi:hypothetical protein
MTHSFQLSRHSPNQFNPFEHPVVLEELSVIFKSMLPFADRNKGVMLGQYLRHHSINRVIAASNPPLMKNIVSGNCCTAATESLFAVNEGNNSFCNDLEYYIQKMQL